MLEEDALAQAAGGDGQLVDVEPPENGGNDERAGEDDVGAVAADAGYLLPLIEGESAEVGDGLVNGIPGQAVTVQGVEGVSSRGRIDLG